MRACDPRWCVVVHTVSTLRNILRTQPLARLDRWRNYPQYARHARMRGMPYLTDNHFSMLAKQTGLSVRGVARLLGVRVDSVLGWIKGRRTAPPGVLAELRAYVAGMDHG